MTNILLVYCLGKDCKREFYSLLQILMLTVFLSLNIVDEPESNVYQTQDNVYQLLRYDGKSTTHGQWEPPTYQGLAKSASEGNWGVGEAYTNPSMYQDLKKNEGVSNGEYLPAYHPLMKSTVWDFITIPLKSCPYIFYSTFFKNLGNRYSCKQPSQRANKN